MGWNHQLVLCFKNVIANRIWGCHIHRQLFNFFQTQEKMVGFGFPNVAPYLWTSIDPNVSIVMAKKEDQQQPPSHHHHHHQPPPSSCSIPSFRARPHLPAWRAWHAARAAASRWPWATRRQIPCASRRPAAKPRWPRRSCNNWHRFRHHGWGGCCCVYWWLLDDYFRLEIIFCYVLDVQFLRLLYFFKDWIWELDFSLGIGFLSGGDEEVKAFQTQNILCLTNCL